MILAIDFDNVIHDPNTVPVGGKMGRPMLGTVEAMQLLAASHTLIVHTLRARTAPGLQSTQKWLEFFKIPFDNITAVKPDAAYFVDDKALHFDNWKQVLEVINGRP